MLRRFVILALIVVGLGFAAFWGLTIPATVDAAALGLHQPDLGNGREMLYAAGCPACHAVPGQEDVTRLGGGLALKSPFGTFYAPNISPDPDNGIGAWTEAQFVTALTKGTSPDGRHYYPAFPYTSYQRLTYADIRDLYAYLRTLPPVQGRVRGHDLPFPFNIRRLLGAWKLLFLDGRPFVPNESQTAEWNRGAYLANAASHCAECHSPRNFLGGLEQRQLFAGGPNLEGDGWVPNITQKGIADWSAKDIAYMLETGQTPDGDSVGSSMTALVRCTSHLTAADRTAIAIYIKSLPPVDGPPKPQKKVAVRSAR
ncbi:MAG: c-type cytochrome [Xanthobacteraceae bacterium]